MSGDTIFGRVRTGVLDGGVLLVNFAGAFTTRDFEQLVSELEVLLGGTIIVTALRAGDGQARARVFPPKDLTLAQAIERIKNAAQKANGTRA
jgi:hypothetical protein